MEILTKSAEETKIFGKSFTNQLKSLPAGRQGGLVLALVGELGSGKTTFVQGLAEGLGIKDKIISPTFVLMRQHKNLYHIDLYRLEKDVEQGLLLLGVADIWGRPENIVVIEWADKARGAIPEDALWIEFKQEGEGRRITVSNLRVTQ